MRAWITPVDADGCRWRIEVWPSGRVEVYRLAAGWVSSSPESWPRDIGGLGEWLLGRGISPEDLTPA